jgi:hypothetical protein
VNDRSGAAHIAGYALAIVVGGGDGPLRPTSLLSVRSTAKKDVMVMGLPIGIGIVIGIVIGAVVGGSFAIGIGIVIGMLVGAAIGATLRASSKPQS